ncbi:MAG: endonuclease/exonuclease/phosphatase family protein [Chloroflexi bacterium]|nr:endonuclease/exonuclease/phosphatase family protein [Chloroflexota bacterium]
MSRPPLSDFYHSSRVIVVRGTGIVWRLVLIGIFSYGCMTSLYLLARLIIGEQWHWVAFANNLVPWWALGALISGGVAIFSRRRWVLIVPQMPMLCAFIMLYGPMYWPERTSAGGHDGIELSAATYNLKSIYSQSASIVDVLQSLDTTIIGVQELARGRAITLREELGDKYPYQVFYLAPQRQGVGLLSQYPVLEQYVKRSNIGAIQYIRVVLDVEGTRVAVYVVHPHTPVSQTSPFAYDDADREESIAALLQRLTMEKDPVLMLCDCNLTDQSDDYHKLDHVLDDSFREAGWGLGFTFSAKSVFDFMNFLPVVRLDYVWHSPHFTAYDAYVVSNYGTSDHHPVVARLILEPTESGE